MTHIMVKHRVNDYRTWKHEFDNFAGFRRSSGEKSFHILQNEQDPNDLYLMFEWDTPENARKFMDSSNLKEAMTKAGVAEAPQIKFLNEFDRGAL